ncbi:extracellular solute-binding protein [Virgibacillus necropolis]|uniref:extracellular solute-binding protein n=1 Tax=Virgibacillus necropolis TaxID=163877 RepID=UPI00384DB9FF
MKVRNLLLLITISFAMLLAACTNEEAGPKEVELNKEKLKNLTESGMPIVKEPISLDIFAGQAPATAENWNDVMIWNKYEDMTNIDVNWEMVPFASLKEKRNLALASGNLPDAFHTAVFPNVDLLKYGNQGVFIKLNDLIDKYAPNLKRIFEQYPEVKKALTFPDGNIYSFPTIYSPEFTSLRLGGRPWFRQDWLDALGMDLPKTTEEFYQYLKAVKEKDPNGNGKADEVPYGGTNIGTIISWLEGSFGVGNRGVPYIDMDPKEQKVRFFPIADGYKEMLKYVNKLYSEKLIQQNIFSIEWNQYLADASKGMYGSTVFNSPEELFAGDIGKKYTAGPALVGPQGDQLFTGFSSPVGSIGGFVITNKNENPAATVRWMDHFYSDKGAKLFFMGIEGKTYKENAEGDLEYLDKIKNSKEGLSLDQELSKYLTWPGGGYPGIIKKEFFKGTESAPSSIKSAELLKPNIIEEAWPDFTYTLEENKKLSALGADIEKYVDEMQDKFITGDLSFSQWDKYVKTLKDMGLEEYMEIQQAAYERYASN